MRFLVAFCCFLLSTAAFCQSRPDSLLQLLEETPDSNKAGVYSHIMWHYCFRNPDTAMRIAHTGIGFAKRFNNEVSLAGLYNRIGVAHDVNGNADSAIFFYEESLDLARKTNTKHTEAGALNNLGLVYWNKDKLDTAVNYYLESAEIFEAIDNQNGLASTYNNLGLIFIDQKLPEQAIQYFDKAREIRILQKDEYGLSASFLNMAIGYSDIAQSNSIYADSVEKYLESAIQMKKKIGDQYGLAKAYNNYAIHLRDLEASLDSVIHYYDLSMEIQKAIGNEYGIASTINNLTPIMAEDGDVKRALELWKEGFDIAKREDYKDLMAQFLWNKALIYSYQNETDSLVHYAHMSRNMRDSLDNERNAQLIAEYETQFNLQRKEQEILELDAQKAQAELQVSKQRSWMIGIGLGAMLLFSVLAIVFVQRKRKNEAQLAQKELAFRKELLDATVLAEEKERQRIAKDLHDGLVQSLAILKIGFYNSLKAIGIDPKSQAQFDEHLQNIDKATQEAREISHQMMPKVLIEVGLIQALEDMLQKTLRHSQIKYRFEPFGIGEKRFASSIEIGLYRIAQELVNNILKHSGAQNVIVQVIKTKSHLVLHVEDDGKGFEANSEKASSGIGLNNILSRASSVNGEVNYEDGKPGTVANIRVPLA